MDCFSTYFTYFTHFTYVPQTGVGWGCGVGCNDTHCTCTHIRCYAIVLAHMFDATQLHLLTCWMLRICTCAHVQATQLYLRTCSMLRNCTCAHVRCYAIGLAHMFDATQLHLGTCSMLRNCTWAHVRCYAIAPAHMLDATQLHLHTSPRSHSPKHLAYSFWTFWSRTWTWRAELLRVNPHLSKQQFLKHLAKVC